MPPGSRLDFQPPIGNPSTTASAANSATFCSSSPSWSVLVGDADSHRGSSGDELTDAKARQAAAREGGRRPEGADRRAQRSSSGVAGGDQADERPAERHQRRPRRREAEDHRHGRPRSTSIRPTTTTLVGSSPASTRSSRDVQAKEGAKEVELAERKALLAERVRGAYDTDRTSLLESFLSGGTFTDLLTEMSYYIDVGEQDKALATRSQQDQETLAALHQTVADTRARTDELRGQTAAQKATLDKSLADLKTPRRGSRSSRSEDRESSRRQKADYAQLAKNKAAAKKAMAKSIAAQKKLQRRSPS